MDGSGFSLSPTRGSASQLPQQSPPPPPSRETSFIPSLPPATGSKVAFCRLVTGGNRAALSQPKSMTLAGSARIFLWPLQRKRRCRKENWWQCEVATCLNNLKDTSSNYAAKTGLKQRVQHRLKLDHGLTGDQQWFQKSRGRAHRLVRRLLCLRSGSSKALRPWNLRVRIPIE